MDCPTCSDSLSSLIDGELNRTALAELRAHLAGCASCSQELALLCCDQAAVSMQSPPLSPVGLWSRVEAALGPPFAASTWVSPVLTPDEAANYLRVGIEDLMLTMDQLPHFLIGSQVRLSRSALEEWVAGRQWPAPIISGQERGNVVDLGRARARLSRAGRI